VVVEVDVERLRRDEVSDQVDIEIEPIRRQRGGRQKKSEVNF